MHLNSFHGTIIYPINPICPEIRQQIMMLDYLCLLLLSLFWLGISNFLNDITLHCKYRRRSVTTGTHGYMLAKKDPHVSR